MKIPLSSGESALEFSETSIWFTRNGKRVRELSVGEQEFVNCTYKATMRQRSSMLRAAVHQLEYYQLVTPKDLPGTLGASIALKTQLLLSEIRGSQATDIPPNDQVLYELLIGMLRERLNRADLRMADGSELTPDMLLEKVDQFIATLKDNDATPIQPD